jgi:hypothetical protein
MTCQKCTIILVLSLWLKSQPRDLVGWHQESFPKAMSIHCANMHFDSLSLTTCLLCRLLSSILEPCYMAKIFIPWLDGIIYNYIEETHLQSLYQFSDHAIYPRRLPLLSYTVICFIPQCFSFVVLPWIKRTDDWRAIAVAGHGRHGFPTSRTRLLHCPPFVLSTPLPTVRFKYSTAGNRIE